MAKKTAYFGMFVALAFLFSYIESLIPINLGIPGVKLGLANLVVIVSLYVMGARAAFAVAMARILLSGFTFGSLFAMLYSMAGGLLSFGVMALLKKSRRFSVVGVSVAGGVFHNVGQILVAILVVRTVALVTYLPILMVAGVVAGVVIGILGAAVIRRVERLMPFSGK